MIEISRCAFDVLAAESAVPSCLRVLGAFSISSLGL
jgi:hypothetical protein